jgi:hypothetical protein
MQQWEYHKLHLNDLPEQADEIDILNDAGKDGWELITITPNNMAILKRQITRAASHATSRRTAKPAALAK